MIPQSQIPYGHLQILGNLCASAPDGAICEVGVYKGGSAYVLAQAARGRPLHLFDTFTGIPAESHTSIDVIGVGQFADCSAEAVQIAIPSAILHIGHFPATLPDDLTNIAFLHIDCDGYTTCKAAIELIYPRMPAGGIIAFDDFGFSGIQRAIKETFGLEYVDTKTLIPHAVKK